MKRLAAATRVSFWAVLALSVVAVAQTPEPTQRPSEYALRLTPDIARGMAREFVRDEFVRRFQMDRSHEAEAIELVARRMMAAAHAIDTDEGQATAERLLTTVMGAVENAESRGRHSPTFTPEQSKSFANDVQKFMPAVRTLVRDVAQDVRPMLPMAQQLRFAGELMVVQTLMDGFESTMQRWSAGGAADEENPFEPDAQQLELGPDGASDRLRDARKYAAGQDPCALRMAEWEEYLSDARAYYGLDDTQMATAQSILREVTARAEAITQNGQLAKQWHGYMLWEHLCGSLGAAYRGYDHPLRYLMARGEKPQRQAVDALDDEFKSRIERIPRDEQRRAADQSMEAQLVKAGLEPAAEPQEGASHAE